MIGCLLDSCRQEVQDRLTFAQDARRQESLDEVAFFIGYGVATEDDL